MYGKHLLTILLYIELSIIILWFILLIAADLSKDNSIIFYYLIILVSIGALALSLLVNYVRNYGADLSYF